MTLVGTLCTAMLAGCGGQTSANDKAGGDAAATGDAYNVTVIWGTAGACRRRSAS